MLPDTLSYISKQEKAVITDTVNTGVASSRHGFDTEPTSPKDFAGLKDSLLAEQIGTNLKSVLCFDAISCDWYEATNDIWASVTPTRATKVVNDTLKSCLPDGYALSKLNAVESFLKPYLSLDAWETDKTLLPLKNGVLNIQTKILDSHSASHRFRWCLPFEYDPLATCPTIKQWLWGVTKKNLETCKTLRACFKAALIGGGKYQKFLEIVGPGETGKSTLVRLLVALIGQINHAATDLRNLENNRFESAALYGERLALISDSSRYGGEVSVLKSLTGGDPIRHERKNRQQGSSFVFDGFVIICSNEPIQSSDYSSGLSRRRIPIHFNQIISENDKSKWRDQGGIEAVMRRELPGLLNWVLAMKDAEMQSAMGELNGELTKPQREHYVETNKLAAWLDDCIVVDESSELFIGATFNIQQNDQSEIQYAASNKLYPNYQLWCINNGVQPIAVQRFSTNLEDVCRYLKLPVKLLPRNREGRRFSELGIRANDSKERTPVTHHNLNADKECRNGDEDVIPETRVGVNGVDCDDQNLLQENVDVEAF